MAQFLKSLRLSGFKSIRKMDKLPLRDINIVIGANGAGKSNLIDFFRMVRVATGRGLAGGTTSFEEFFEMGGGLDKYLFGGPKVTDGIQFTLDDGNKEESFSIRPNVDEKPVVKDRDDNVIAAAALGALFGGLLGGRSGAASGAAIGGTLAASTESSKRTQKHKVCSEGELSESTCSLNIAPYHFHDTSAQSKMRRSEIIEDSESLRLDAANIAPFLLRLKNESLEDYQEIVEFIKDVAPFFDDFTFRKIGRDPIIKVNLEWRQVDSDYPMQPYHLSDGTLRFICLATALLQPDPPEIIIIDEPELGLHPSGLLLLSEMIKSASERSQVIIATQSSVFIDYFAPEDIVVVNRKDGASEFQRLDSDKLALWLEDYSLGQLWRKNVIAGGPDNE